MSAFAVIISNSERPCWAQCRRDDAEPNDCFRDGLMERAATNVGRKPSLRCHPETGSWLKGYDPIQKCPVIPAMIRRSTGGPAVCSRRELLNCCAVTATVKLSVNR